MSGTFNHEHSFYGKRLAGEVVSLDNCVFSMRPDEGRLLSASVSCRIPALAKVASHLFHHTKKRPVPLQAFLHCGHMDDRPCFVVAARQRGGGPAALVEGTRNRTCSPEGARAMVSPSPRDHRAISDGACWLGEYRPALGWPEWDYCARNK